MVILFLAITNKPKFNITLNTMRRKLRFLSVLIALATMTNVAQAQNYNFSAVAPSGQTLYYSITDSNNHTVSVVNPTGNAYHGSWDGFNQPTGTLTIPSLVSNDGETYTVTSIGGDAFSECNGLTGTLVIPSTVTSIGDRAFAWCSGFTGTLFIPSSVTYIGYIALTCSGITSIVVDNENSVYDSRNNCNAIINTSNNELVAGCQNTIIPNSVTAIGQGAFGWCSNLTSIIIPNSVTSINFGAFAECSNLSSISLPNSVTSISWYAFQKCTGLTGTLIIPDSVTYLGYRAFDSCVSLTSVDLGTYAVDIDGYAFNNCTGLTSITSRSLVPPPLRGQAFYSIPTTTPVYVPCGSVAAYQAASGWSDFTGITCFPQKTVTLSCNNDYRGITNGSGTYDSATLVVISATPNTGFRFLRWSDGNTDNPRSLTLNNDIRLVAKFQRILDTPTDTFYTTFQNDSATATWVFDNADCSPKWYIGKASNLECNALYVSHTGGQTNAFFTPSDGSTWGNAAIFAYTELYLTPGYYNYSIIWKNGDALQSGDHPSAYIASEQSNFNASNSSWSWINGMEIGNGSTLYGLNWRDDKLFFEITEEGNYNLVFRWINDATYGMNPPVAIRSVRIEKTTNPYIILDVNNAAWGTATCPAVVNLGDSVMITATPAEGCLFHMWSDSCYENPRRVVASGRQYYTAMFYESQPINGRITCDFENPADSALWQFERDENGTKGWFIGDTVYSGGHYAIYASADSGSTYGGIEDNCWGPFGSCGQYTAKMRLPALETGGRYRVSFNYRGSVRMAITYYPKDDWGYYGSWVFDGDTIIVSDDEWHTYTSVIPITVDAADSGFYLMFAFSSTHFCNSCSLSAAVSLLLQPSYRRHPAFQTEPARWKSPG